MTICPSAKDWGPLASDDNLLSDTCTTMLRLEQGERQIHSMRLVMSGTWKRENIGLTIFTWQDHAFCICPTSIAWLQPSLAHVTHCWGWSVAIQQDQEIERLERRTWRNWQPFHGKIILYVLNQQTISIFLSSTRVWRPAKSYILSCTPNIPPLP